MSAQKLYVVQHLRQDTLDYLTMLDNQGAELIKWVAPSYSVEPSVFQKTKSLPFPVEIIDHNILHLVIQEDFKEENIKNIGLLDVGGYGSTLKNVHSLAFIVEETNRGLWQYRQLDPINVIEIASVRNKEIENIAVGKAIFEGALESISDSENNELVLGIIGYGGIGRNVARAALVNGVRPIINEIQPFRIIQAMTHGLDVVTKKDLLTMCTLVIGVTGKNSLESFDLRQIEKSIQLVSGSSKDIEFKAVIDAEMDNIHVINEGTPINFKYGSLSAELGEFLFMNLNSAIQQGMEEQKGNIRPLSLDRQDRIAEEWLFKQGVETDHLR